MFLTLEGVEGAGKSTLAAHLAARLECAGRVVLRTREPGGCPLGRDIRALLLDCGRAVTPRAELYLFLADRAQHVDEVIRPALARGEWVLCDRYADSTIAYQGGGRELGTEKVAALNAMAVGDTLPDITVYLRMPADKALSRRLSASEPDRLEREKTAFFTRTYDAYEELFAGEAGKRTVVVNAAQSIEDVTREMLDAVDARLFELEV